jgi:hypothetical protein
MMIHDLTLDTTQSIGMEALGGYCKHEEGA